MSRIGKRAVAVPSGVTANVEGQTVKVKGPKGMLSLVLDENLSAKLEGSALKIEKRNEGARAKAMWGTSRTLVNNLMAGVTKGFERKLEITGVGYRAAVQGKNLQLCARLQPRRVSIRSQKASRSRPRSRPKSSSPASTTSRSGRSPPRSASIVRRSPTRARA